VPTLENGLQAGLFLNRFALFAAGTISGISRDIAQSQRSPGKQVQPPGLNFPLMGKSDVNCAGLNYRGAPRDGAAQF
jgi:hypothetical protein